MNAAADWPATRHSLIANLQQGSQSSSWELFVDVYGPLLYRYCRRRHLQDADANDVVQNVFLAVRRSIKTFDARRGRFRAWLGTITYREIQCQRRRHLRAGVPLELVTAQLSQETHDAMWEEEFQLSVLHSACERIRSHFEPENWQAFMWLWQEELQPAEVAARLNKPVEWVYRIKYRVLLRLRKEIEYLTDDLAFFVRE